MAITVGQLAAAIRLTDGSDPPEPQLSILNRMMGAAEAHVEAFADTAPQDVKDEAVIRMAGFLFEQSFAGRRGAFGNAFRYSGAAALLAPWVVIRTGITPTS